MDAEEPIKYPAGPFGENHLRTGPPISPFAAVGLADIRKAFEPVAKDFPPILSLEQAAELAGVVPSTLKRHVSEGQYKNSVSRRKPLRFFRDLFAQEVMRDKPRKPRKDESEGTDKQDKADETR